MTNPGQPEHPLHTRAGRRASTREEVRRFETIEDSAVHVLSDTERSNLTRAGHPAATIGRRLDRNGRPKRIHPDSSKKHGTRGCHDNWGCRCAWVPGTGPWGWFDSFVPLQVVANFPVPGCERAAAKAAGDVRERRRMDAPTVPIPLRNDAGKRDTLQSPPAPRQGRTQPPAGSAFAQLANPFKPAPFTPGAQPA